ncbi:CPBP family intramembrane glutamic endopeptidase [Streptococcus ictaluri]|uniref:CAAX amino terminal protease family protein n=1 Tax=Streptococcus ictaluri 707-05 TaxID=764299 RepID=G5K601_9STRE|nr:type II CAAX endopeptidase family protein [Streptococcus ictaluri]EHI68694.1 CAAX amino terminal protease family protein [Streptococcus ictaluri 707-05]
MLLLQKQAELPLVWKWILGLAYLVLVGASLMVLWRRFRTKEVKVTLHFSFTWKDLAYLGLFWLSARVIAIVGTLLNQAISGQETTANDAGLQVLAHFMTGGFPLFSLLYFLVIAFIAPIMEELAFRGYPTLDLFKGQFNVWAAIVTLVIFSLPHATNAVEFITYAGMGVLLYLAYRRRGNLLDSIFLHILNNLPAAIYLLLISLT